MTYLAFAEHFEDLCKSIDLLSDEIKGASKSAEKQQKLLTIWTAVMSVAIVLQLIILFFK